MKSLNEILNESIFDIDDNINKVDQWLKDEILEFLNKNFHGEFTISDDPDSQGKYTVYTEKNLSIKRGAKINTLTNGKFIFADLENGDFYLDSEYISTLEGCPKNVQYIYISASKLTSLNHVPNCDVLKIEHCYNLRSLEDLNNISCNRLYIENCHNLRSLEGLNNISCDTLWIEDCHNLEYIGCDLKITGSIIFKNCKSLKSLENLPKKINGSFMCDQCMSLKSLKGIPEEIGGHFQCTRCMSLKSLKYIPKKIPYSFTWADCGIEVTKDDIRGISKIKGKITVQRKRY